MEMIVVEINVGGARAGLARFHDLSITDQQGALKPARDGDHQLYEVEPTGLLANELIQRIADDLSKGIVQGKVRETEWRSQQADAHAQPEALANP